MLALAKHPLVDEFDLSSLEYMNSGAAPLSAELEVACGERLGCHMQQGYGLTETSPVTHFVADKLAGTMPGSIGRPVPNTECRIVDVVTGQDVPAGEPGELCIRGPQVMKGYLNNPEATAHAIDADGWFHTGDVARLDDDGSLWIVDRIKELIKYKGYQIAPAELEALLLTHPAITDAAVIPVRDEEAGEIPKAFVVARRRDHRRRGDPVRRRARRPLQEDPRGRDRRRDPEVALGQDPAPGADRARARARRGDVQLARVNLRRG